jgi:hypothetical protein
MVRPTKIRRIAKRSHAFISELANSIITGAENEILRRIVVSEMIGEMISLIEEETQSVEAKEILCTTQSQGKTGHCQTPGFARLR